MYQRLDGQFPRSGVIITAKNGRLFDSDGYEVVWVGDLPRPNAPGQGSNPFPETKVGEGAKPAAVVVELGKIPNEVDLAPVLDMLGLVVADLAKLKSRFGIG